MRLLPIPRAAILTAQRFNDFYEILISISLLIHNVLFLSHYSSEVLEEDVFPEEVFAEELEEEPSEELLLEEFVVLPPVATRSANESVISFSSLSIITV